VNFSESLGVAESWPRKTPQNFLEPLMPLHNANLKLPKCRSQRKEKYKQAVLVADDQGEKYISKRTATRAPDESKDSPD
jgi:hypothetical protein